MPGGGHHIAGRWRRLLATLGLGICVGAADAGPDSCEDVLQAANYQLRTRVLHAGTRSEGRVGRLFRDGIEVSGRSIGESIEVMTTAGTVRFSWLGEARPHLWSISGWTASSAPGASGSWTGANRVARRSRVRP